MSAAGPPPNPRNWKLDRFYRRTLPAYWIFLACATHFPKAHIDLGVKASDKVVHFIAYGLLAFLLWRFAESVARPLSGRFAWIAGVTLLSYGALDELTQPFFNRGCELLDWLCDAAAVVGVMTALELRRRSRARLAGSIAPSAESFNTKDTKKHEGHEGSE